MASGKTQFVCLFVLCSIVYAQRSTRGVIQPNPLWRTSVLPPEVRDLGRNPPGLTFLGNDYLVVSYVRTDTGQLSSRTSPDLSSPFRLHLSVLDADVGKTSLSKEWGTRSTNSSVQATSGGLVVRTGDVLRLCSRELVELGHVELPQAPYKGWEIRVSASGKTVLLNQYQVNREEGLSVSHFEALDGDTLKTKLSWSQSPAIIDKYAITDKLIAADRFQNEQGEVLAAELGTARWKPLFELSHGVCSPGRSGIFISESLLVCASQDFMMSSTNGDVLMTDRFKKGEGKSAGITVARDGSRAAVMVSEFRDIWDTGGHIKSLRVAIYDLTERKRITTVLVAPPPKQDYGVALSPDGSRLAILNDQTLLLYLVPPAR